MLSNNRLALGFTMLLAGCASGSGYGDAPRIADPSAQGMEEPYRQPAPRPEPRDDFPPDDAPEPGAPSDDTAPDAPRATPGAGYSPPGTVPAYREPRPLPADAPPALTAAAGPRGTSGEQARYDAVGYASWYGEEMGDARTADGQPFAPGAIGAAHRTLPFGSVVEVTALDTGRTILVLINDRGPGARDREIDLSRGAAQALGLTATAPVRVRLVTASASDTVALRQGRAAGARIDAPPSLLAALRRKLPARAAAPRTASAPPVARPSAAPRGAGLFVQVAALSNAARAQALADSLGGRIERAGSVYRVQIGPFANPQAAQRARDDVARRGYGDARIVQTN